MVRAVHRKRSKGHTATTGTPTGTRSHYPLARKLVLGISCGILLMDVAWQFDALKRYISLQDTEKDATANSELPTQLQQLKRGIHNRQLSDQEKSAVISDLSAEVKRRLAYSKRQAPLKKPQPRQSALAGPSGLVPRPNPNGPKKLERQVPAVMCASHTGPNQCQIKACPENSPETTTNATQLPSFLKPYPSAHYGYGFVHRESTRGIKMQTSGSAKAGSGCAISHKYKFIFIHVLKSGGTTMKGFLQDGLCGSINMPCANGGPTQLQIVNCASAVANYPNYFVFSFVRNPYSRMYSAYAMAHSFRSHPTNPKDPFSFETFALAGETPVPARQAESLAQAGETPGPPRKGKRMSFSAFAKVNRTKTTSIPQRRRLQEDQPQPGSFSGVLQNLALMRRNRMGPAKEPPMKKMSKNQFRWKLSFLHPSHYEPQTNYLFSKTGCPVVDFIGHLETMHDDLKTVLTYIGSPELWQHFEKGQESNNANKQKTVKTDSSTAFGSKLGGNLQSAFQYDQNSTEWSAIQRAVAKEYQRDFHLLGYDPSVVPSK